jgi:hypothetical protein
MAHEMSRRGFFGWLAALLGLAAATAKAVGQAPPVPAGGDEQQPVGGRLTCVTDPLGHVATYTYDYCQGLWQGPDQGPASTYVYDANAWQLWQG